MDAGLIWILAGILLLGADLVLPGIYLVWAGLAAIGTGVLLLRADPGLGVALATFLALFAIGVAVSMRMRRQGGAARRINAPETGLAGRRAVVIAAPGPGLRVRLGDSDWPARLPRGVAAPAVGSAVRVEAVDGTVLVVRPDPPADAA